MQHPTHTLNIVPFPRLFVCAMLVIVLFSTDTAFFFSTASADNGTDWASYIPVVTFFGLCIFVAIFGGLAIWYKSAKLDHHVFAFGLPPGTIRATIAIGILVIFLTVPTYLFMQLGTLGPSNVTPNGTTISSLPANLPEGMFAVEVKKDGETEWLLFSNSSSTARERLAFQIFTAISTTLAAISAFYFGARTAQHSSQSEPGVTGTTGSIATNKDAHVRVAEMRAVATKSDAELEAMKATLAAIVDLAAKGKASEELDMLKELATPIVETKAPDLIQKMKDLVAKSDTLLSTVKQTAGILMLAEAKELETFYERFQETSRAFKLLQTTLDNYLEDAQLASV